MPRPALLLLALILGPAAAANPADEAVRDELAELYVERELIPPATLVRLAIKRRAARLAEEAERHLGTDGRGLVEWLTDRPRLAETLLLALDENDDVRGVLLALDGFRRGYGEGVERWPDLVTAFCVVWDDPDPERPYGGGGLAPGPDPRPEGAAGRFERFRQTAPPGAFDAAAALPWELSVFVAGQQLTDAGVALALRRWGRGADPAEAYAAVPYDDAAFGQGRPRRVASLPYTLANLLQVGGMCEDQAYAASQACRATGVPAARLTGTSPEGVGHAWVGRLREGRDGGVGWDLTVGAWQDGGYHDAAATDPQVRRRMTAAELRMRATLPAVPRADRHAAAAAAALADLMPGDRVGDELRRAVDLAPGRAGTWRRLAGRLAERDERLEFCRVVAAELGAEYGDEAVELLDSGLAGLALDDRLAAWHRVAAACSRDAPRLAAEAHLRAADLLAEAGDARGAWLTLVPVLERAGDLGPQADRALRIADATLPAAGEGRLLLGAYAEVWGRLPRPDPASSVMARQTVFHSVGRRYADLLDRAGDPAAAADVRRELASRER